METIASVELPPKDNNGSATTTGFLGKPVELCIVTRDHRRTIAGLLRLGIGPF
jgi:methylmalonyl-CoA/ethylmalonyl-CoA epimerase